MPAPSKLRSLHLLGSLCALTAGAWLGGAEAPTKLVTAGFSPFTISLCMVFGVFVARWTLPTLAQGTGGVWRDLARRPHLMVWAVLAGGLWAIANTLTIIAIRDVGLSIAFPLWNINTLVGLFWGWFLFRELRGASRGTWMRVLGGAIAIVVSAAALSAATVQNSGAPPARALAGIAAALGAGLLWGTMYVPYRKAYISGLSPLSFVTIFTVGELGTMAVLVAVFAGPGFLHELSRLRPSLFWLFLGGFCWVVGDIFQQYATKYIGISRAIPLANTNQLWGLAWGALVFGEFASARPGVRLAVLGASAVMILGAAAIASAAVGAGEEASSRLAVGRECDRYGMGFEETLAAVSGAARRPAEETDRSEPRIPGRPWWDWIIVAVAGGVFVVLGAMAHRPPIALRLGMAAGLAAASLLMFFACGWYLWKKTGFE